MLRLTPPAEPVWLDIMPGVRVLVRPWTTAVNETALAASRRIVRNLADGKEVIEDRGGEIRGLPDLDTPEGIEGLAEALYIEQLAMAAIIEWDGVGNDAGEPVDVAPQWVRALMAVPDAAAGFRSRYCAPMAQWSAEGKGYGASSDGTTDKAPPTASTALN